MSPLRSLVAYPDHRGSMADLFLRKERHPQALNNYRVILKTEDGDVEIGSIGVQD
jgi:hypothetical protein